MFTSLPENALNFIDWPWSKIEPYCQDLLARPLTESNVSDWLAEWSQLGKLLYETYQRLWVATTVDTTDKNIAQRYTAFLEEIYPYAQAADQKLKEKLLDSGLEPDGFAIPLRNMRAEAGIFQQANLPLLAQELKLGSEYDRIVGAQTIQWDGKEFTLEQLKAIYQDPDRQRRERAWRLAAERQLADREAINELWTRNMQVRAQIATNAGLPDFRAYRWRKLLRFDYTPQDCARFHQAIEMVGVPAAQRLYERRRRKLGVDTLRPWDLLVAPDGAPPLRPFEQVAQLVEGVAAIFQRLDPQLAAYFEIMRREGLLDLDNRKGKAPGGYCTDFPVARRPFIFMNAIGVHEDVQTLLHEGGHAFHVFESASLPYLQQLQVGLEFSEVASTAMELLTAPYLTSDQGGFYTPRQAAQARVEFLESLVCYWPYMAVVDAFQHWVYENHQAASDPANCDAKWTELWERFMPGEDWNGLEQEKATGWQRKLHIHQDPFYYIEYGLAQLGALQLWSNALKNPGAALAAYRRALALGGTASIPQLFAAAGIRFAFDQAAVQQAVDLAESTIQELEENQV
ncbi:MAG: M3 family oligoendopeptidase [Anaerolineales bacterium]|nr:M3 family oligoendopeptidase [Anaerolineales bacterium]